MPVIYQNLQSKCIEIIQLAFMCTICNRVQRVLHLGANKFAPPREEEQIRKTPFTWPNIHPGCKFTPRVQIAHMNINYTGRCQELFPGMWILSYVARKYAHKMCEQQRLGSAYTSMQSDQSFCTSLHAHSVFVSFIALRLW